MKYAELVARLEKLEKETGLYLTDQCVDLQNMEGIEEFAGLRWDGVLTKAQDDALFSAAASNAQGRADEAGLNINELLGFVVV